MFNQMTGDNIRHPEPLGSTYYEAQQQGIRRRLREALEKLEVDRWEDDGGAYSHEVVVCVGCGATEEDPACSC